METVRSQRAPLKLTQEDTDQMAGHAISIQPDGTRSLTQFKGKTAKTLQEKQLERSVGDLLATKGKKSNMETQEILSSASSAPQSPKQSLPRLSRHAVFDLTSDKRFIR
jgi:hypothetical protein